MGARSSQSRGPGLNETDGHLLEYFRNTFAGGGGANSGPTVAPVIGLTATGGVVSDYTSGSDVYRAHIFTSSGTFAVTALGNQDNNIDYLAVAGGGSGSPQTSGNLYSASGGGGAGGLRTSLPGIMPATSSTVPVAVAPYSIIIGAGGAFSLTAQGNPGTNTSLAYNGGTVISNAGGGGGETQQSGLAGGSGGGQGGNNYGSSRTGGAANPNSNPTRQGYPGTNLATGNNDGGGGGGGGAGAAGEPYVSPERSGCAGGAGVQVAIAGPTATTGVGAKNPANNQYQYFAGGGGGGGYDGSPTGVGGVGGGGRGETPPAPAPAERNGQYGTGGGGGGAKGNGASTGSGSGGSGIVVVRYKIAELTATAKASGGAVSFYGGKTIHAFTSTGDFNNTTGANLTGCEVAILGGGGGGNVWQGAGGGAGRFYRNDDVTLAPGPQAVTIGAGGVGARGAPAPGIPVAPSGTQSVFNSVTMPGGGGGGLYNVNGAPGGSGGGGSYGGGGPGAASPGNVVASTNVDTPSNGAGNAGGAGASPQGAGGGGGAGAVGTASPGSDKKGGSGGAGVQLPSTFRNPISTIGYPGPSSALHFVGGGGGGSSGPPNFDAGGGGGAPQVPSTYQGTSMTIPQALNYEWAGAGSGVQDTGPSAPSARENSGSGGGGTGSGAGAAAIGGGNGGSGLVLIAYPS